MRIVITLDIENVGKSDVAVLPDPKPKGPKEDPIMLDTVTHTVHNDGERTTEIVHHAVEIVPTPLVGQAAPVDQKVLEVVPAEPVPAPKKRGRKRKTVDMGITEEQALVAKEAAAKAEKIEAQEEAAKKADIPAPVAAPEPAPVAAPVPVLEPAKKADISMPVCPVCKEPMMADERYDAYLCIKDGQFNNSVKPSSVKAAVQAALQAMSKIILATPEVKATPRGLLTEEEQKDIKTRLGKYWVDILPNAGMTAEDGKSINAKLTDFANTFAAGREWPNSRSWDAKQWGIFLSFMDGMVGAKGAKALVAHINQEIGSK